MNRRLSTWIVTLTTSAIAATQQLACQRRPQTIPLWEQGAPGFESRRNEPEEAKDWWVRNIHQPSLMAFLPSLARRTGAAVIVAPGGGFEQLVFGHEGIEPARLLSRFGVAAFALKYRLPKEPSSPYGLEHVRQDAYRAVRLVRHRASEWGIDPNRVGMLGFSAGGALVSLAAYAPGFGDPEAQDPVDRQDGKPSFQMLIYPGGDVPEVIPPDAPPTFLLAAMDDEYGCDRISQQLFTRLRAARVPVEAHFLARGKHGFNMGDRSNFASVRAWPQRMLDWMQDSGYLNKSAS